MSPSNSFLGSTRGVTAAAAALCGASLLAACGDDGRDTGFASASASAPVTASSPTGVTSAGTEDPTAADPTTSGTGSASETGTSGTTGSETTEAVTSTGGTTGDELATSTSTTSTTTAVSDSEPASSTNETSPPPDFGVPPQCIECGLTVASQQSGSLAIIGPNVFATAELMNQTVYAFGNAGAGRFIASGDSSLPFNEVSDCPIVEWLGNQGPTPKLFWFGWGPSDGPANWNYPGDSSGIHLPAKYVGNPALLAQDYDIVMYLEGSGQFDGGDQPTDLEMQTLYEFVTVYGGGAYISSEFAGYLKPADYVSINRVLKPLGVEALSVNLNWGNVNGQIQFQCFPAPQ